MSITTGKNAVSAAPHAIDLAVLSVPSTLTCKEMLEETDTGKRNHLPKARDGSWNDKLSKPASNKPAVYAVELARIDSRRFVGSTSDPDPAL